MFVLGACHRAQVERGQMTRVSGLDAKRLANREREFGTDQSLLEQFAFKSLSNLVDRFGRP